MTDFLLIIRLFWDLLTGGDPTLPSGHNELIPLAVMCAAIRDYLLAVLTDGDWLNDWLTWIPVPARAIIEFIGHIIAIVTGS